MCYLLNLMSGVWGNKDAINTQKEYRKRFGKQLFVSRVGRGHHGILLGIYYNEVVDEFIKVIEPNLAEIQEVIEISLKDDKDYLTDYIYECNELIKRGFELAKEKAEETIMPSEAIKK